MNNKADVQYIIPISSILQCPTNYGCMTIAQYFDSLVNQLKSSKKLKLHFLPGEHILESQNCSMTNVSNVQLVGLPSSERNVELICSGDCKILFDEIHTLRLEALHFISNKSLIIEVFGPHVCEVINIDSVNTSMFLHFVTFLRAENVIISNTVSGRSLMIIEKCTGVLFNLTIKNNIATAKGKIVNILSSALHMKGSMYAVNNTSTLQTFRPSLIFMGNTSIWVSAHMIFSKNTKLHVLWALFHPYTNIQQGELTIYRNFDMLDLLVLNHCTLYIEQQANITISDNISQKNIIVLILYSFLEVNGITNVYNNYAQEVCSMSFKSGLILAGNASFTNNINSGTGNIGGCVIFISDKSFLHTKATVTFESNTGQLGSGISVEGSSTLDFNGITTFVNNSAIEGGAIHIFQFDTLALSNISIHFQGLTIFANNSAARGGAIYCQGENVNISFAGNTIFTGNKAEEYGAHLTFFYCNSCIANFSGSTTVEVGVSVLGGVITATGNTLLVFNGMNIFTQNSVMTQVGNIQTVQGATFQCYGHNIFTGNEGGVFMFHDNAMFTISGITFFGNNFNPTPYGAGAIFALNSSGILQGYVKFVNNTASESLFGLIGVVSSRVTFQGNIHFLANSANGAAALSVLFNSNVKFMGNATLALNTAERDGGAIACIRSSVLFQGFSNFERNEAKSVQGYGGAIHAVNCKISLKGVHVFNSNKASHGGALSLVSDSRIVLLSVNLFFINNSADFGGAMYIQDTLSPTDCMDDAKLLTSSSFLFRSECFFDTDTIRSSKIKADSNYANEGNFLLGGKLNRCTVNEKSGDKIFLRLFDNSLISAGTSALITSQPYRLCFCSSHDNRPNCQMELLHIRATRGELFTISVAALDQLSHAVFSTVRAELPENSNKISRLGSVI